MKRAMSFLFGLENYTWKLLLRLSPSLPYIGALSVALVIVSSVITHKTSVVSVRSLREASIKAARVGDYSTAQKLYEKCQVAQCLDGVLGVMSEVEDLIFPELVVEREIQKYEALLEEYPGHRDIYIVLAKLYTQINMGTEAQRYYDLARELDPNNEAVILF